VEADTLALIWFGLLGVLLTGYAILDGFDLGVGIMHLFIARDDRDRRLTLNSIGPLWDGNEVWLVTFGGAMFAAFPEAYATIFSGFYSAFILLLFALIFPRSSSGPSPSSFAASGPAPSGAAPGTWGSHSAPSRRPCSLAWPSET
jgi:cytochrome d oxidase subunit CydB